ncbi:MAG: ATP-binding protein, partial [bacterium]
WISSFISRRFRSVNKDVMEKEHFNKLLRKRFFDILLSVDAAIVIYKEGEIVFYNRYAEKFGDRLDYIVEKMLLEMNGFRKWNEMELGNSFFNFIVLEFLEEQKVIMFSDITELKRKDMENERTEKMAAIGKLTASIAHEIKNPLTSLIGATEIIVNEDADETDRKQLLRIVRREGKRVKKMLDDLFNFTSECSAEKKPLFLNNIIEDTVFLLKKTNRNISFHTELKKLSINGNEDRLKEVFMNIFQNSIEAMDGKGMITVIMDKKKDTVFVTVRDEGGGFPENAGEKIFDPFFSTKKRGTGLGLALVYKIITMHGGRISAETVDGGTEVEIKLPEYNGDEK